jgi:hypothetical protein
MKSDDFWMACPEECDPDWNQMSEPEAAELIAIMAAIDPNEEMASASANQEVSQ